MYFNEYMVELHQERLLTDLNCIVGIVGGSLGMFVGVSCLGAARSLFDKLERALERKRTST